MFAGLDNRPACDREFVLLLKQMSIAPVVYVSVSFVLCVISLVCLQNSDTRCLTLSLERFDIADADIEETQRLRSQQPGDDAVLRREAGLGRGEIPFEEWVGDTKMTREPTGVKYLPSTEQTPGADREIRPGAAPTEVIQQVQAPHLHAAATAGGDIKILAAPTEEGPQDLTLAAGQPGAAQETFEDWVGKDQMQPTPTGDIQQVIEGDVQRRTNVENFQQKRPDSVTFLTRVTTTEHIRPVVHRKVTKGVETRQTKEQLIGREIEEEIIELPSGFDQPDAPGLEKETSTEDFEQTLPNGVWEKKKVIKTKLTPSGPRRVEGEVTQKTNVETFEEKLPDGGRIIKKVTTIEHVRPITNISYDGGVEKKETKEQFIGKEVEQDIIELPSRVNNPEAPGLQKKTANEEFEEALPDGTWVINRINRTMVIESDIEVIEGDIEQRTKVENFEEKQPNGVTVIRKVITVEHVQPIHEITYDGGEQKTETIEKVIGREIEEDVVELPPGITDPSAEGLSKETATAQFEDKLPDGSWVRKRINNTKVSQQEAPKIIEGEIEQRTNVETFEENLDNGGLLRTKVTTTDHIRPITEVKVTDGVEDVQTIEKLEGREILEEVVELPAGVKDLDAEGLEKETSVEAFDQTLPDGTWEKKKVSKTKVTVKKIEPTVNEGQPILKTNVETFEDKLDNGSVRITHVKTTEHIKPITEVLVVKGVEKMNVTEELMGKEIVMDIIELPPGVTDSEAEGMKSETAVEEFDETLLDGTWQKTKIKKTRVIPAEPEPMEVVEGDIQLRTKVDNFEEKLGDGGLRQVKITTTYHIRPVTEVRVVDGSKKVEKREQLEGTEILEEAVELPPGVTDINAEGLEKETSVEVFDQTQPDGTWEKKKVSKTKVTSTPTEPTIIEGRPVLKTSIESFEDRLDNGFVRITNVKTTEHIKPITETLVVKGVEKKKITEELIGKEIDKAITDLPPGITDSEAEGLKQETVVEEFDETLPDGTWQKTRVKTTTIKLPEQQPPKFIEGEIELKTNVETFKEQLPEGVTLLTKRTTIEHIKPVTEIVTINGTEEQEKTEQFIGKEIIEDVVELPFGVIEPVGEGLRTETSVQQSEETLPDGTWEKKKVKKTVVISQVAPAVIEGEVQRRVNVDSFEEKLDDGSLVVTKVTTVDHVRPITGTVLVKGIPQKQTTERFEGKEIIQDVVELPPGVTDTNAEHLEKQSSVQASEQVLPDATWEKMKITKTKVILSQTEPTIIEGKPILKTSVETFDDKLDNGIIRKINIKTTEHVKPITELLVVQGVERKNVTEHLVGREIEEEWTELPPGVTEPSAPGVQSETAVEVDHESTLPNGVWEKKLVKKTTVKVIEQAAPPIVEGEIQLKTNVQTFREQLPEGVTLLTQRTTVEHVKPIIETVTVDGVDQQDTTEQFIGKEIIDDVVELPFGVIDPIGEGLGTETSVEESEETLPDGTWEKKKVKKTVVISHVAPQAVEGELQHRTNVETFENKLDDGSLVITKVTSVDHIRPITGTVVVNGVPQQQTLERLEGREIFQDIVELPPGVKDPDAEGIEKETSVEAFQETLPDGSWEKKKISKTKATITATEPTIIEGHPVLRTSVETFEDRLDNGRVRVRNVKVTEHIKPITEILVVKGIERKKVTEQLVGREIEEEVTELPPGVKDPSGDGLKTEIAVEQFEQTLPDGVWEKKSVKTKTVELLQQAPPVEGEVQLKTNVETFREQLPHGATLLTQRTTTEHIKPITETVTVDGVDQQDTTEQFIGKEIIEDVTELPFGVIEPVGEGLSTETSVKESEETMPDGTWEKKKVKKTVVISHVAPQAVEGELQHRTNVETFENKLDDGSLVITKVTTVDHIRPITGTVVVNGVPQQQTLERLEGREIFQNIVELPPGVKDPDAEGIEKETSVEAFQETLPDGSWKKKKISKTKATITATEPTIIEGHPVLKTSVETFEEKLDNGTIRIKNVKVTEHVKPITEILIVKGVEKKKVTEQLIGREIEEDVKELPAGVEDLSREGVETQTTVKEFEATLPDGIWEKKLIKTTKVKVLESVAPTKIVEGDIEKKTYVETFEDKLPDGGTSLTKVTTTQHVRSVTKIVVVKGVESKTTSKKPVGKEVEEEITELPPGVTDPNFKGIGKETSVQKSEQTLPDGTWVKKITRRTRVMGTTQRQEERITEEEISHRVNVQTFEERLGNGVTIIRKITTTEHVKPVTEVTVVGGVERRTTREQFLGRVIEEDVTQLPPGVREVEGEGLEQDVSVEEFEESLPDGTWVKKIIRRTEVTRTKDQAPPQELTARTAQVVTEQLATSTAAKTKISMEGASPQLEPPSVRTRDIVMPEDALDVEEDEFEETLEDGTVINKRIITTRTATTITRTVITVMPDGSIKEEVIREDVSGPERKPILPKQISEEVIPVVVSRPQAPKEPPREPIDDDEILPDVHTDAERSPPRHQKSIDEGEVVPQYREKRDDLPSLIVGPQLTASELDEVEETLPDGTVVKRRAMKTKVRKIITKKIRRVGPDGEVIEDVFTEEVPESDISETSSIRSGFSADARDVVSPIPYVSSPHRAGLPDRFY